MDSIPEGAIKVYTDQMAERPQIPDQQARAPSWCSLTAKWKWLRLLEQQAGATAAYFLSDSQHTLDLVEGRARPNLDLELVHAVREGVRRLGIQRKVHFGKVAGHCGLAGNDAADALATLGVQRSSSGNNMRNANGFINDNQFNIYNDFIAISDLT